MNHAPGIQCQGRFRNTQSTRDRTRDMQYRVRLMFGNDSREVTSFPPKTFDHGTKGLGNRKGMNGCGDGFQVFGLGCIHQQRNAMGCRNVSELAEMTAQDIPTTERAGGQTIN